MQNPKTLTPSVSAVSLESNKNNNTRHFRGSSMDTNNTNATSNSSQAPVRTTKALLLSLTVPRIHRVYVPPPKQWTNSTTTTTNNNNINNNNNENDCSSSKGANNNNSKKGVVEKLPSKKNPLARIVQPKRNQQQTTKGDASGSSTTNDKDKTTKTVEEEEKEVDSSFKNFKPQQQDKKSVKRDSDDDKNTDDSNDNDELVVVLEDDDDDDDDVKKKKKDDGVVNIPKDPKEKDDTTKTVIVEQFTALDDGTPSTETIKTATDGATTVDVVVASESVGSDLSSKATTAADTSTDKKEEVQRRDKRTKQQEDEEVVKEEEQDDDDEELHVVVGYIQKDETERNGSKDIDEVLDLVTAEELETVVKLQPVEEKAAEEEEDVKDSKSKIQDDGDDDSVDSKSKNGSKKNVRRETWDASSTVTKESQQSNTTTSVVSNLKNMVFAVMSIPNPEEVSGQGDTLKDLPDHDDLFLNREQTMQALRRASYSESNLLPTSITTDDCSDDDSVVHSNQDKDKDSTSQQAKEAEEESSLSTSPPQPNTEIRMEALVRMTFRNLYQEGHFLNLPLYAHKMDSQQQPLQPQLVNQLPNIKDKYECQWVQVDVMVKEPSIGIIFERLDRIGVGSLVGTLAIFKAELCQTAAEQQTAVAPGTTATTTATPLTTTKSNNAMSIGRDSVSATAGLNASSRNNKDNQKVTVTSVTSIISDKDTKEVTEQSMKKVGSTENPNKMTEEEELELQEQANAAAAAAAAEAARAEWKAAASRLRVEQVKEQIHEQAKLSFDFLALLSIASILAGIGLITNSTVVIVASMLVSPIMGPVMGMTFGSRVLDWELAKSSFRVESIALLLAVAIGALIGIASSWAPIAEDWPTEEMASRGSAVGLATGVAIAIPSGMGVALSILGNHTASLVGVAISASLLPPAVNAGICWAHAFLIAVGAVTVDYSPGDEGDIDDEDDFAVIGAISFALTVVNIVCIWLAGQLMFAIKEVEPSKHDTQSTSAFWSRDIKVARAIQKGNKSVDMDVIKEGIQKELQVRRKEGKPVVPPTTKPGLVSTRSLSDGIPPRKISARSRSLDDVLLEVKDEKGSDRYVGLEDMANFLGFDEEDGHEFVDDEANEDEGWSVTKWLFG